MQQFWGQNVHNLLEMNNLHGVSHTAHTISQKSGNMPVEHASYQHVPTHYVGYVSVNGGYD